MISDIDEKDYKKLIDKATRALLDNPNIEPSDIVSEVVLEAAEQEKHIYFWQVLRMVFNKAKAKAHNTPRKFRGVVYQKKYTRSEQTRVCFKCRQPLPISAFYIARRGKGAYDCVEEILYSCKPCQIKAVAERNKKCRQPLTYPLSF